MYTRVCILWYQLDPGTYDKSACYTFVVDMFEYIVDASNIYMYMYVHNT